MWNENHNVLKTKGYHFFTKSLPCRNLNRIAAIAANEFLRCHEPDRGNEIGIRPRKVSDPSPPTALASPYKRSQPLLEPKPPKTSPPN
jgi:hypothetical protein